MPSILDHFDALTDHGLKVIPLRQNSKVPLCKGWTKDWSREKSREKLMVFPEANIGLLLGDVVDVEGDSEEANNQILELIGDYPHPTYQSTKSIHHLFLNPDPKLRHFRWGDIEFRGWGHQSVLPPSHHEGVAYRWLRNFKFPVPQMPDRLYLFYEAKRGSGASDESVKPKRRGHLGIWCAKCQQKRNLHRKRLHLERKAFELLGERWQCNQCRQFDLRAACRLLRSGVNETAVKADCFGL